jgi:hypothetical protein
MDLRAASQTFTDMLRHHYRIRTHVDGNTVRAANGSTDVLCAATHEAACVSSHSDFCVALILRRPKAVSEDEGVLT